MDDRDKALVKIAVEALRAVHRNAKTSRHCGEWRLAIGRIIDTKATVEADEEIQALRRPIQRAPSVAS